MSYPRPIRWLTLCWLLAVALDVTVTALGWTQLAVGLTALVIGVPLGCLMHQLRETMATYGASAWEFGPIQPVRLPLTTRPADPRPSVASQAAAARRLPEVLGVVQRAAVLLLISTTVVTLRTAVALRIFAH